MQYAFGVVIVEDRDIEYWRERFAFWWEVHPGMWWFDLKGRVSAWIWTRREKLRAKVGALRELDAFRALVTLEPELTEWPRAFPLLERAVALYDTTHQVGKRDAVLKRLAEVDPTNVTARRYGDVAKKVAQAKVDAVDDSDRRNLETARRLMRETGCLSTSMLQRRMGISYNHAAYENWSDITCLSSPPAPDSTSAVQSPSERQGELHFSLQCRDTIT